MEPGPHLYLIDILQLTFGFGQVFSLILFVVLLACSALISGSEVALFSLKPSDFNAQEELTDREKLVVKLLDRPKKLLATILVANNFINIAIVLTYSTLSEFIHSGLDLEFYGISISFLIDVILVTFLILMFGEILPKVYANRNNMGFSLTMAYPLSFLDRMLSPVSVPMRNTTRFIESKFGKQKTNLNVDQLSKALELTHQGETTKEEKKILEGIVNFGNTDTKQVMQPRMDIFALSLDESFEEVVNKIVENGYSRIPVYKESIDDIEGVLYIKDLLPHLDKNEFQWKQLLRQAYFVPENKKLDDLLNEFKKLKIHVAIVVDEYGGTSGLITLEDIIEEIVGDISDEFDDEDLFFSKLDQNTYVFEGKTPIKDFYHIVGVKDEEYFDAHKGEAETLAGFTLELFRNFPKIGQYIDFSDYQFTVEAIDERRIKQIKVKIKNNE